jgi:hypothetical protein
VPQDVTFAEVFDGNHGVRHRIAECSDFELWNAESGLATAIQKFFSVRPDSIKSSSQSSQRELGLASALAYNPLGLQCQQTLEPL